MQRTDLKIFKSERMTQQADAGGQRTSVEVQNGQLNEGFGNISDIDHAQSAVDIVKVYPAVNTNDTQLLQDGHILINEPPLDPLVDVMIVESTAINDGSERADIISAIEGGVVAGMALRTGLSGMIAGQDTINPLDLTSVAAPSGEQDSVTLKIGDRIVIAVEYTGSENAQFPRFQHFCEVTSVPTIVSNSFSNPTTTGNYSFYPAIPKNAPDRGVLINGQSRCTVLRRVASGNPVKAHGVTQLTSPASGNTLQVGKTKGLLMPRITEPVPRLANRPFLSADTGLERKLVIEPAASGKAYTVNIFDYADIVSNSFVVLYQSAGKAESSALVSYANNVLSINTQYIPDPGTNISITYYSANRYQNYSSADALPVDYAILSSFVQGSVLFAANGTRYTFRTNSVDPTIIEASRENTGFMQAAILQTDGTVTYYNGWSDIEFAAIIENQIDAGLTTSVIEFALPYVEILPATFYVVVEKAAGGLFSASGELNGDIAGVGVTGGFANGIVQLTFTEPVKAATLVYDVSEVVTLIPPPELYGINPLRMPDNGRVSLFHDFGVVCISNNQYVDYASLTAAQTISRRPDAFIDIVDADGVSLWHPLDQHFTYDKDTGDVTIVDVAGFTAPFELIDTLSELALVTDVSDTQLKIASPLQGTFAAGSIVSSVYKMGDMQAVVSALWDQTTWSGDWLDILQGDAAAANYNAINYPIELVNQSAINERWIIIMLSETAFRCIGQNVGQVATGDTLTDFAPINPATNEPYFVIRTGGWGGGWQPGNALRFNTSAAAKPAVLLRSVSAGHSAIVQDSIRLHFRGNAQ